ncbi:MAG: sulfatase-like hydrolase/transferase [Pseudomonadota bacterium]
MKHRCGLLALVWLGLTACQSADHKLSVEPEPASQDRPMPNIVLILADDLGIGDVGVYGGEVIATPNIDALAARGVQFEAGYVTHPVCSPSRAGLLTGRYQQRFGWEFNPAGRDRTSGMSRSETTLADDLRARGYATALVGKWHLGYERGYHPLDRGFDEFFGILAGGSLFIDPAEPGVESLSVRRSGRDAQFGVYRSRDLIEVEEYLTDRFTTEALDVIARQDKRPFFLYLSHTTPHTPLQATAPYLQDYQHLPDPAQRIYAAMVASLDASVGAVVDALRSAGQFDNTLIVFASDNGCAGYIGGACSNRPFAGFKRYHNEGGIRIPLILHWPQQLPAGVRYPHAVSTLDLRATFAAAAGFAGAVDLDGVDLLPHLQGFERRPPHDYLYWRSGPTQAVRDDRWKLLRYPRSRFTRADLRADGRLQPPEGGWPMQPQNGYLTVLYDLLEDPGEQHNLAERYPQVVARLQAAYDGWAQALPAEPVQRAERSTLAETEGELVQLIF